MTDRRRSPISLFVAYCSDQRADIKIAMLRLFCDCIDLSDAASDGWLVHEWLKKAYATERVPISRNSITWLFHLTANEDYVEFGPRTVWSAVQHAVRSVLNHGRHTNMLERILRLTTLESSDISQRHVDALCIWLALRVTGRVLLPMVVTAGSFLQMRGFDWVDDDLPHSQFLQALPNIYAAWCHAVLDAVDRIEPYMQEELEHCFKQFGWTRAAFLAKLSRSNIQNRAKNSTEISSKSCTRCKDDYSTLDSGLVEPARITITECVLTGHDFDCKCQTIRSEDFRSTIPELPKYTGTCYQDTSDEDPDAEEEFFETEPHIFSTSARRTRDEFSDVAMMLYRAQGRVWMSEEYKIGERLCAACFMLREKYIDGKDGLAADFPPMPASFEGLRVKW